MLVGRILSSHWPWIANHILCFPRSPEYSTRFDSWTAKHGGCSLEQAVNTFVFYCHCQQSGYKQGQYEFTERDCERLFPIFHLSWFLSSRCPVWEGGLWATVDAREEWTDQTTADWGWTVCASFLHLSSDMFHRYDMVPSYNMLFVYLIISSCFSVVLFTPVWLSADMSLLADLNGTQG